MVLMPFCEGRGRKKRHLSCQFCGDKLRGALLIITISAGSLFSSHYSGIMKRSELASSGSLSSSPLAPAEGIHPSRFIELFYS